MCVWRTEGKTELLLIASFLHNLRPISSCRVKKELRINLQIAEWCLERFLSLSAASKRNHHVVVISAATVSLQDEV